MARSARPLGSGAREAAQVEPLEPGQSLGRLDSGCGSVTWDSHNPGQRHPLRSSLLWSSRALGSGAGEAAQLLAQRPWQSLGHVVLFLLHGNSRASGWQSLAFAERGAH